MIIIGIVRRMRVIPLLAAAAIVTTEAQAQPRQQRGPIPAGTSSLRGTVIDALSKHPIANCTVEAKGEPSFTGATRTGADGAYQFTDVSEGTYVVVAECPAYLAACVRLSAESTLPCMYVTLLRDQNLRDVDLLLTPATIVRGQVLDADGNPVAKATVRLGRPVGEGGAVIGLPSTTTRNDGTFELGSLPSGEWRIELDPPGASGVVPPPVIYYPGALSLEEAGSLELEAGTVIDGVTIRYPAILGKSIFVRVPPPDATVTSVIVSLMRSAPLITRRLDLDADGHATIRGLSPGRYLIIATARVGSQRWVAFEGVDFISESIDVPLNLQPASRITGRIVADGGSPPLAGATVGAVWVDGGVALNPLAPDEGSVNSDGTFTIEGVFGRRILELNGFDTAWQIQSVHYGSSDVTETGIDISPSSTIELTITVRPRQPRHEDH